jgi:hypothetical protein
VLKYEWGVNLLTIAGSEGSYGWLQLHYTLTKKISKIIQSKHNEIKRLCYRSICYHTAGQGVGVPKIYHVLAVYLQNILGIIQ